MSEMVERVAQAIALAGNGGTWDDWYNDEQREFHRKRARVAIEAMRDATTWMTAIGTETMDEQRHETDAVTSREIWRAMIDAALTADKATKAA